ncbi:MAG: 2-oxo acid dehydrogenase subunit E2 [Chloroflexota bacterium]|nr:MAG: 2-oxo acid dehydrogenase subunit E2 [Chloroflexota bacterium]
MATNVILPHLGLTTTEATIVRWLKQEGDAIEKGDSLVEVLTDKVNVEVEAPEAGILLRIVASEDTVIPVTHTLCWIGQAGEAVSADGQPDHEESPVEMAPTAASSPLPLATERQDYIKASPLAKRLAREHGVGLALIKGTGPEGRVIERDVLDFVTRVAGAQHAPAGECVGSVVKASPLAANLARDLGIDLREVAPSSQSGRITRGDVLATADAMKTAPSTTTPSSVVTQAQALPPPRAQVASSIPLIGLRRIIAQRMSQSAHTIPRVTHTTEADVTELVRMREQIVFASEHEIGFRISYNDIIVKVVAHALRKHPNMNARLSENEIQLLEHVNVGVAVSVPGGLVVPVVHDADQKDVTSIARESRDKAARARTSALSQEDVSGGTFTITNLGSYEIDAFTPIINLPEVAILGVGRIVEKPAIYQGEICKRSMMYLSLTFDHRVNDGAPVAEFLRTIKRFLEKPFTLLL